LRAGIASTQRRRVTATPFKIFKCRVPDRCLDPKRYPLFMAREVMAGVIEQLSASRSKPA
jgi:hypothetical protein